MKPEHRPQATDLFDAALKLQPNERATFLKQACGNDERLRKEVESLLDSYDNAEAFTPALEIAARMLARSPIVAPDQIVSHYRIVSSLGEGGMGEVYRAHDMKLKRDVALKLLPETFAGDPERLARFQREADILASLNHPNIASIYDFENSGELQFLVLEFVAGETLAERIRRGAIPIHGALQLAKQIAEALEAAHDRGIIHLDLKPSNICITPQDTVKVLDFGIAKAIKAAPSGQISVQDLSSPLPTSATAAGMIIGTAGYMSPEQVKGQKADRSADMWAFGCVLFEMLAGRRAFDGESITDLLAAVLKIEPDWNRLPGETPEGVRRLLSRCLRKEKKFRLHDIADARIEIDEALTSPVPHQVIATRGPSRMAPLALAVVTLVAGVIVGRTLRPPPAPPSEVRLEVVTPPAADLTSIAISPDGTKIVFAATSDAGPRLWVRPLDSLSAQPLAGTDDGFFPFWSPDSRSIGFFADDRLMRIDVDSGLVRTLADAPNPWGGAWNRDGTILFAPNQTGPIFRLPVGGGKPEPLTRTEGQQAGHSFPVFLPDGRHFLFYATGSPRGIYAGQLDSPTIQRLLDADAPATYTSNGQLLFVNQRTLFAQDFDPVKLTLRGNPVPIAQQILLDPVGSMFAGVAASAAGPIIYRAGLRGGQRQLVWFDRSGKALATVGEPDNAAPANPSISPDGRRVALFRTVDGNMDIWMLDLLRGVLTRFTSEPGNDASPIWSPDGKYVVFNSNRNGVFDLYRKAATGTGNEELMLATPQNKNPRDWSADGRFILYRSPAATAGFDLWALPLYGERKPFPVVQTNFDERDGQFSPDGKWVAYQTNESGRMEIVVQGFPDPGSKLQVSTNGGAQVRWRRDSKELFYIALDGRLMAVPIPMTADGRSFEAGPPVPLFLTHIGGAIQGVVPQQYDVSADGQRFLMNTVTEAATPPITVILNSRLKR
jgi:serine/threonine protein kinase/Tol biopolymer transport system component